MLVPPLRAGTAAGAWVGGAATAALGTPAGGADAIAVVGPGAAGACEGAFGTIVDEAAAIAVV